MTVGKIAILESNLPNEKRVPVHPDHFSKIKAESSQVYFQTEYAKNFGDYEALIKRLGFYYEERQKLLQTADVCFLLKPTKQDLKQMKRGAILVGWCHSVQQIDIAQTAQERGLTLIAMEAMYDINDQHLFYHNNFYAGMLGVQHALESVPLTFSKKEKVAIITYGIVSQGASVQLFKEGFFNTTVYSRRDPANITNKERLFTYETIIKANSEFLIAQNHKHLKEELLNADIIINGIKQDVLHPCFFLCQNDLLKVDNKLIIDLSCDDQMGFDFAKPTSVSAPILSVENNYYYAVGNAPTLEPETVSLGISKQLVRIINHFSSGKNDHKVEEMLSNATDIIKGTIKNNIISQYQNSLRNNRSLKE